MFADRSLLTGVCHLDRLAAVRDCLRENKLLLERLERPSMGGAREHFDGRTLLLLMRCMAVASSDCYELPPKSVLQISEKVDVMMRTAKIIR